MGPTKGEGSNARPAYLVGRPDVLQVALPRPHQLLVVGRPRAVQLGLLFQLVALLGHRAQLVADHLQSAGRGGAPVSWQGVQATVALAGQEGGKMEVPQA